MFKSVCPVVSIAWSYIHLIAPAS